MAVLGSPIPAALAYALCDEDSAAADIIVEDLMAAGVSVQDVCLHHLAPAAQRLGDLWDRDRLPFTDVTIATARIQSMLRRMPVEAAPASRRAALGACFVAVPGEQHTLGVIMAADLFRRAGWDVSLQVGQSHDELLDRLARDDRPVIGLSCSGDHSFAALKRLMQALRRSRPNAQILLSGQIVHHPQRLADLPQPFIPVADEPEAERVLVQLAAEFDHVAEGRAELAASDG